MSALIQVRDRFTAITPKQWALLAVSLLVMTAMFAMMAFAGDGGDEFDDIYERIAGWLDGTPGKIVATLALGFAFFNVMKQNFFLAAGAFVACLVLAEGSEIIESFLGASVVVGPIM